MEERTRPEEMTRPRVEQTREMMEERTRPRVEQTREMMERLTGDWNSRPDGGACGLPETGTADRMEEHVADQVEWQPKQ